MKFQLVYIKVCFWRCNERFKKVGVVSSAINRVIGTDIKWEGMKKISLNEIVSILKGGNFTKKDSGAGKKKLTNEKMRTILITNLSK